MLPGFVDNLTHSLLGAALAKTRLGALTPRAAPLLVLAANLPDADLLSLVGGKHAYLIHHRGVTHSVLGVLLSIPVWAAFSRWWDARRAEATAPLGWRGAFALAAFGIGSHPALDYLNTYGWRPWLPFDGRWLYGDWVFIVDPWLWLLFGGIAALAGQRSRAGSVWLGLAAALGTLVIFSSARSPMLLKCVWPLAVVGLGLARRAPPVDCGRLRARRVWATGVVLLSLYLGSLALLGPRAEQKGRAWIAARLEPGEAIEAVTHAPAPAHPLHWTILVETDRAVWCLGVELGRDAIGAQRLDKLAPDEFARRASRSPCAAAWRSFARHPIAFVEHSSSGTQVTLTDARYQVQAGETWCSNEVLFDQDGRERDCR
jgi:inner membrane protein